jgi:hypothetical protein
VYSFLSGVAMSYEAMYHKWFSFWIAAGIFIVFTMAVVYLNYQRFRAVREFAEMRERLEQNGRLMIQSGETIQSLLVDNVRLKAIIAGLVGMRMTVHVEVKRGRR